MNKHLHRIIFNAARGLRMVVQETARSTGKGAARSTARSTAKSTTSAAGKLVATGAGLLVLVAQAQIVGAPNVPGNLRPTVLVAPNGVPLVNIQTPSAAGVSRNVYSQFDVQSNGVILNNSRTNAQTQLGGWVQGNPWLATGSARVILNEINSGNPSQLRGFIEVGGQRAEVIVANPAGIAVNGGGFINASRATLTTGVPQLNAVGGLDSFLVRGGTVSIDGAGLDLRSTDYAAILARAVQVNAGIWASELKVVTGANDVSADHAQITPVTGAAGAGPAPAFALDVAALGGMYAGKITLIGTEAGLGVRNAGNIGAGAGGLVVTAAGRLENTGTLEGARIELASASDIDNRGGTIRQTSDAALTIAAPTLSNTQGGWIGAEPLNASTGASAGTGGATSPGAGTGTGSAAPVDGGTGSGAGASGASASQPSAPPSPGSITAASAVLNDGGKIYAGGPITLQSPNIINNGGTLSVANMAVSQPRFDNRGGTLNVSSSFSANVEQFDNTGGTLQAGSLNIAATGDINNQDGKLTSDSDITLSAAGTVNNNGGTLTAARHLGIDAGALQSDAPSVLAAGALSPAAVAAGAIPQGNLQITTQGALVSGDW